MHFHLPKPLHGWREFFGEVGIVVLGILIALGAEQVIQGFHDRHVADQSRRDVREEVGTDIGFYRERLQESPCIAARLKELSTIVQGGAVPANAVKWVGRPSDLAPFTERWRAVTSSARTALFPPVEQSRLDAIYGIFAGLQEESRDEEHAWTNLGIVAHLNGPIDTATRLSLVQALEQARRTDEIIRLASYYALFHAHALGIASNPETSPRPDDIHSICLALSTDPARAEQLLQPRLPH